MTELFLRVINMSISAGWLILAVLAVRLVLRRAPRWVYVLLWGVVAARLLFPFSIESAVSLIPSAETIPPRIETYVMPAIDSGIDVINGIINPAISQSGAQMVGDSVSLLQIAIAVGTGIWGLGVAVLLLYAAISYWHLSRKVDTAVLYRENIFRSESVTTPFVLGVIRPRIYLPVNMGGQDLEHVVAHEQAHIHRRDHWWKPLGFLLLIIHWFNPLMWLAYVLLCRDIELACDERAIRELDSAGRADYTQALLNCSTERRSIAACPLAFGEVGIKERVKMVMDYRKPAVWIIALAIVACAVVAVCFLTNPKSGSENVTLWFDRLKEHQDQYTIEVPEFPGVTFRYAKDRLTVTAEPEGDAISRPQNLELIDKMSVMIRAYFCDLTGDGFPELCSEVWVGSGIIDVRIVVYDYLNDVSYELQDRGYHDFYLRLEDGCLYADKKEYKSEGLVSSGRLVIENGILGMD